MCKKKRCKQCGEKLINKGKIQRKIVTHTGEVCISRYHYVCESCGKHEYPADEIFGLSRSMVSKYCAQSISLVASFVPFEHARNFINQLLRIDVSETCIEGVTHRIGLKLYHDAWIKGRMPYGLENKREKPHQLYIQIDGAMVPICGSGKVEFKENKLAVLYKDTDIVHKKKKNGEDRITIKNKHYISSLAEGIEKFREILYAASVEHGAKRAEEIIILGDGAPWISRIKEDYFPNAIQILDWYHASEHLWETAHKLFGENTKKCEEWVAPLMRLLWEGNIEEAIRQITKEALQRKKNQTPLFDLRSYYMDNKKNMKYDEYRKKGYTIGSGAIESANKYIVAQRLKLSGMQWTVSHANAMIYLRCKYFDEGWNDFWKNMIMTEYYDHNLINMYKLAS